MAVPAFGKNKQAESMFFEFLILPVDFKKLLTSASVASPVVSRGSRLHCRK